MELSTPRFAMVPLFLLAAVFSLLAPLYWTHVEAPPAGSGSTVREDQEVYGRILPAVSYSATRIATGELPLWASGQYCGVPFFANPEHGVFQPLNWVFTLADGVRGLALHAFLGLFFAALFMAMFVRALGAAYIPSAIGGMVYAFCGATATVMSRPELLGVVTWTPLLYWAIFEYTREPRWWLSLVGGMVAAAVALAGAAALALFMVAGAFFYGLLRGLVLGGRNGHVRWSSLRGLAVMAVLGMGFSAIQYIPTVVWLASLNAPWAALWPRAWPGHLPGTLGDVPAGVFAPGDAALPGMLYFGVVSWMLIPAALLQRHRRFEVLFFLISSVGWIALAVWGSNGAPGADHWKVLVFPAAIGVAVLAGLGADRLLLTGRDPRSPLIWGAVLLALLAAIVLVLAGTAGTRGPVVLAVLALLPFFIMRVRWLGVVCGCLVAMIHFVDLQQASGNLYLHPYSGNRNWLQASLPAIKEAEAQALGQRMLVLPQTREPVLPGNIGLMQPVACAGGAYWPLTREQAAWWDHLNPYLTGEWSSPEAEERQRDYASLLNVMGVRVILGERPGNWMEQPNPGVRLRYLTAIGQLRLWKNDAALSRVRWVSSWMPADGVDGAIETLSDPSFPSAAMCVVDSRDGFHEQLAERLAPGAPEDVGDSVDGGTATLVQESPEELTIAVNSDRDGMVVVSDTFAGGWTALVDGKRAPIYRVNGLFRGVYVSSGEHEIVLAYAPFSVTAGILVSGVAILGSVLWCLYRLLVYLRGTIGGSRRAEGAIQPADNIEEMR